VKGFLLDTNVVSELRKGPRMNVGLAAWYEKRDRRDLFISVITLAEIRRGIRLIARHDRKQGVALARWCDVMQKEFARAGHLLSLRASEADVWAELCAARPLPLMDAFLAATAKSHGLTLVTRNTNDFKDLPVAALNPFR
jgi:hypothetical protein